MFRIRIVTVALCLCILAGICCTAQAVQTDCDAVYCFSAGDFAQNDEPLTGVCVTGLPAPETGTVLLGNRVVRKGDILSAQQLEQLRFVPLETREDAQAEVTFLPIYEDRVETAAVMTISIRGKENKAPVAEDSAVETYKNLPNQGKLLVSDPEGEEMTYTVQRQPRRGQVELKEDGTFVYTPKKNKVGVDSFTYTATDAKGNVSREATVTVQILKPMDSRQYTDTVGMDCRFEAEWLKNTGLFVGETINGDGCFQPEKPVSRGEFMAMVVNMLEVPLSQSNENADAPQWLRPYLAAAQRAGLTAGWPEQGGYDQPITGGEAAVMLQNALDLTVTDEALETFGEEEMPQWAAASVTVMAQYGMQMDAQENLTRGQVAEILYEAKQLTYNAPGMAIIRMQQ